MCDYWVPDNRGGYHGYLLPGNQVPTSILRDLKNNGDITPSEYKRFLKGK